LTIISFWSKTCQKRTTFKKILKYIKDKKNLLDDSFITSQPYLSGKKNRLDVEVPKDAKLLEILFLLREVLKSGS